MILKEIADFTRARVEKLKQQTPINNFYPLLEQEKENAFSFEMAIDREKTAVIAEIKKASPSKGMISPDMNVREISTAYERGGAAALSVLTEPEYFLGSTQNLQTAKSSCRLPVLRKDFTVDEYQIYEARAMGADAVLLIVSLLSQKEMKQFIRLSDRLGLSCLVETKTREEIERAADCGARVIGINNRNLADFSVTLARTEQLAKYIPSDALFVAESGIKTASDARAMSAAGAAAVLVGESLMRSTNIEQTLKEFTEAVCKRV